METLENLKKWFNTHELPKELQLNAWTYLPNVKKSVGALISTLEAHPGNWAYMPYYNTLVEIKNRIENNLND